MAKHPAQLQLVSESGQVLGEYETLFDLMFSKPPGRYGETLVIQRWQSSGAYKPIRRAYGTRNGHHMIEDIDPLDQDAGYLYGKALTPEQEAVLK